MKATLIFGAVTAMLLAAGPARADHKLLLPPDEPQAESTESPKPDETNSSFDIDLKVGLNGFRLGGRLFGSNGFAGGAWLNGETRADGFSLDGRVERDGKAHNFKMNINFDEWLRRAAGWWAWGQSKL
jgi:hypothetical protein